MDCDAFPRSAVREALGDRAVCGVELIDRLPASCADVARIAIAFDDGRPPLRAIGKAAGGTGLEAVRHERRVLEALAALHPGPAPALLGACECGQGDGVRALLVLEDLAAAGYRLAAEAPSAAQLAQTVDVLAGLHARFWGQLCDDRLDHARPSASVTRTVQAWPPSAIARHAAEASAAAQRFAASPELIGPERSLLEAAIAQWPPRFAARAAAGRLTLIHGDFHILGNILFADGQPPRVIDWSEVKPGLGPHDLAYCLLAVPAADRHTLARRYWEQLQIAGAADYSWALCQWDYQISLIGNLFQAIHQDNLRWFRITASAIAAAGARAALDRPPPIA